MGSCIFNLSMCYTHSHYALFLFFFFFLVFWTFLPQPFWIRSRFGLTLWFGPLPAFIIFCLINHWIGLAQPLAAALRSKLFPRVSGTELHRMDWPWTGTKQMNFATNLSIYNWQRHCHKNFLQSKCQGSSCKVKFLLFPKKCKLRIWNGCRLQLNTDHE